MIKVIQTSTTGILTCLLATLLVGCATTSVPDRSNAASNLPDDFTLYGPVSETSPRWWESFESPELNAWVDEALSDNFSIRQAYARMNQASAIARQSQSFLAPQADYSLDTSITANHSDDASAFGPGNDNNTVTTRSYRPGASVSYEVDLWGRIGAGADAASLDETAAHLDLQTAMHSVAGSITRTWLDLIEVHQILNVTQRQLENNKTNLELNELRFRKGSATALDVFQQREAVAQTETLIAPLESQRQLLLHALNVLMGKAPRTERDVGDTAFPKFDALPEYGLPADLLARRPDVQASGLRLQAADWRVSAAQADRLPSIQLSAGFSFNGDSLDTVFDNWIASLAQSVVGPIFDAGRRKAEVERTQAVVDERLNQYRLTVLTAVREVEDSLAQIDRQQVFLEALGRRFDAATNSYNEALNRYRKGLTDYLPVLTALTNMQNLERNLIQAQHDLLSFRIALHLAIGGEWMSDEIPRVEENRLAEARETKEYSE